MIGSFSVLLVSIVRWRHLREQVRPGVGSRPLRVHYIMILRWGFFVVFFTSVDTFHLVIFKCFATAGFSGVKYCILFVDFVMHGTVLK